MIAASRQQHKSITKSNAKKKKANRPKHYASKNHEWEVALAAEIRNDFIDGKRVMTGSELLERYRNHTQSSTTAAHGWRKKFLKKFSLSQRAPSWNSNPASDDCLAGRIQNNWLKYDTLRRELLNRYGASADLVCVNYDETPLPNRINK